MSTAENKEVVRRFVDSVCNGNLDAIDVLIARDIVVHTPVPGVAPGLEGFRQFLGVFLSGFLEQRIDVEDVIAEGDRVVVWHTHHATHGGDFMGMPPTGKQVIVSGIEEFRVTDGKIAEMWHQDDLLGLMQQLGAVPAAWQ